MRSLLTSLFLSALVVLPASTQTVSVAYAGSLVSTMEGPFALELQRRTGLVFEGEPKGSRALGTFIAAGLRDPDVFISADESVLRALMGKPAGELVRTYVVFASSRIVVAYSARSAHRRLLSEAARGHGSILQALCAPGLRVGRTDPLLDPKGARTIMAISLLGKHERNPSLARALLAAAKVFPEEDLAVRVESGELDAGFFYAHEVKPRSLLALELPSDSNLSGKIAFAAAQMSRAPHPQRASRFLTFLLHGEGRRILEEAGLRFFQHPRRVSR